MDWIDSDDFGPPLPLQQFTSEQRKSLASLCQLHDKGPGSHRVSPSWWHSLPILAFCFAACAGLILSAGWIPSFFPTLLCGFLVGVLMTEVRNRMTFERLWPLYETIIDWGRASHLLKKLDARGDHRAVTDVVADPPELN